MASLKKVILLQRERKKDNRKSISEPKWFDFH